MSFIETATGADEAGLERHRRVVAESKLRRGDCILLNERPLAFVKASQVEAPSHSTISTRSSSSSSRSNSSSSISNSNANLESDHDQLLMLLAKQLQQSILSKDKDSKDKILSLYPRRTQCQPQYSDGLDLDIILEKVKCNSFKVRCLQQQLQPDTHMPEPHRLDQLSLPNTYTESLVDVGVAVYDKASYFNHSCNPNAVVLFGSGGDRLVGPEVITVKAIRDIDVGQEVFISYGPLYSRHAASDRQRICRGIWGFTCRCEACEDPVSFPLLINAFNCISRDGCSFPIQWDDAACQKCKTKACVPKQMFEESCRLIETLATTSNSKEPISTVTSTHARTRMQRLAAAEKIRNVVCHPLSLEVAKLYDEIARELVERGAFDAACDYLSRATDIVGKVFGSDSIEMRSEAGKCAGVWFAAVKSNPSSAIRVKEACLWVDRAVGLNRIFSGGGENADVVELKMIKLALERFL